MVRGKFYSGQEDLTEILKIRKQVFQEELGIAPAAEEDGQDGICMHVLAYDGDVPVATGRIYFDGFDFVISRVAVLPEFRGKKYGDFIVRMLIDRAVMTNADQLQADVFEENVAFFETIGFKCQGERGNLGEKKLINMVLKVADIHKCCSCK